MSVWNKIQGRMLSTLVGRDNLGAMRKIQSVVRSDGITAIATDGRVVVETTFGQDLAPDTFFRIINTGGAGTTWTIDIAGTSNDPSTPDRDVPAYQKIFTVQVSEEGDEIAFRDRIIQELNADTVFRDTIFMKCQDATDRAVVHLYSEKFSGSNEFWERPTAGDFNVTIGGTPGDGVVVIGFDNIISRSKPITISRDFDSPHIAGLFGITGNVNVTPKDLDDLFIQNATDDGTATGDPDLLVNGSGTPQDFFINPSATTDLFIEELRFYGQGNGLQYKGHLTNNTPLTNGIEITIKSDDTITILPLLKTTADYKNKFAFGQGAAGFSLDIASGRDDFLAVFTFPNPFIIKVAGTFSPQDDFIRIRIQDNISNHASELEFLAKGFEKEP